MPAFAVRYICLKFGYKFGTSFLNKIEESGMMPKLTFGAAVLGLMVIGAMIPSMITVNIVGAIGSGDAAVKVQDYAKPRSICNDIRNLWAFAEKSQSFMDIDCAYGRRNCWSTFRYFLI